MNVQPAAPGIWRIEQNGKLHLQFHSGQAQAWDSHRRFVAVISGTQGGKTSFAPWWLWREILTCGPGDYIAATSSYDLFKLKFLPEMRTVFEHLLGIGRWWASDRIIEIRDPRTERFLARKADDAMWARIILRSAASGSGLESTTAKGAVLDEAGQKEFVVETWEAVLRRLSLAQGRALITTTPYNLGWLKSQVYDRWIAGDADFDVIQFASIMNPQFPLAEYERARRTMPKWRFDMFYRGLFTKPAGLIYADFDSETMVVEPLSFILQPHWPRIVGVDFGAVNTATIWMAIDTERDMVIVYRETLEGERTSAQHAERFLQAVGDARHVMPVGGAPGETQQRMDWAQNGVPVMRPSVSDVEAQIDRVTQLIRMGRFRVSSECRGLLDELGRYQRVVDENGEPTPVIEDRHKFHRLDALRYAATLAVVQASA